MRWLHTRCNPQPPVWQPMGTYHVIVCQTISRRVGLETERIVSGQAAIKIAKPEHTVARAVDRDDVVSRQTVHGGEVHEVCTIETRNSLIGSDPEDAVRGEERYIDSVRDEPVSFRVVAKSGPTARSWRRIVTPQALVCAEPDAPIRAEGQIVTNAIRRRQSDGRDVRAVEAEKTFSCGAPERAILGGDHPADGLEA